MLAVRKIIKNVPGVLRLVHTIENDRPFITRRIRHVLRKRAKVVFVQIGSNDGLHGDPIRPIICNDTRYSGIFIEPLKPIFDRLKFNYNNEQRFIFINAAVCEEEGYRDFFYVSDGANLSISNLPEWWDQLGSFDINHILKHLDGKLAPFIVKDTIKCQKLSSIFETNNLNKLDLVHIDTEGYDYNVLRMLELSRYRPKVILYESKHLSNENKSLAKDILKHSGYRIYNYAHDTLAVHPVW